MPSDQVNACREKAVECEHRARTVSEEPLREMYRDLAKQWRDMARQAEFFDRKRDRAA
jgi:hypothetical protein